LSNVGGKLVYQSTKKRASGPKCPVTGKRIQGVCNIFFLTWGFVFRKGSLKCYSFESYVTHDSIELVIIDGEKIVNVLGRLVRASAYFFVIGILKYLVCF